MSLVKEAAVFFPVKGFIAVREHPLQFEAVILSSLTQTSCEGSKYFASRKV